jgi:hypothetical protein
MTNHYTAAMAVGTPLVPPIALIGRNFGSVLRAAPANQ